MSGIFISYRRDDSRGSAGRLHADLADHFGADVVFRDIDAIRPGAVYGEVIDEAIAHCDAVIVVIGTCWAESRAASGQRRLASPKDFVRREIVSALAHDKVVIPVLVEDAMMPSEEDLPAELARLTTLNALPISDQRWDYDVMRLVGLLDELTGSVVAQARAATPVDAVAESPLPSSGGRWRLATLVLAVMLLGAVGLGAFAIRRIAGDGTDATPTPTRKAASSPAPDPGPGTTPDISMPTVAPTNTTGTTAADPQAVVLARWLAAEKAIVAATYDPAGPAQGALIDYFVDPELSMLRTYYAAMARDGLTATGDIDHGHPQVKSMTATEAVVVSCKTNRLVLISKATGKPVPGKAGDPTPVLNGVTSTMVLTPGGAWKESTTQVKDGTCDGL